MTAESRYMQRKVCDACPFRSDRPFYLDPQRAREFADQADIGLFDCHKTVDWDDDGGQVRKPNTQACAGARATMTPQLSRLEWLARRSGVLVHEVHPDQPVYGSLDEWLQAIDELHASTNRGSASWSRETLARITREGEQLTREQAARIAHRLRTQIGGAYTLIADQIERDHP